jgi:uncharacterized protein YjeT (DUF2065 family)
MWVLRVIGGVSCLVGVIWFGQGIGLIGGSFMTGEAIWAVIGVVAVVIGVTMIRAAGRWRRAEDEPAAERLSDT